MPKSTDITGTFRVPEEAWGKFWNTMLSIPGAEISPNTRVEKLPAKRTHGTDARGSSGKCLVLAALAANPKSKLTGAQLTETLIKAGKASSSVPNILYELKKEKYTTGDKDGYAMTRAGRAYFAEKCNIEEA